MLRTLPHYSRNQKPTCKNLILQSKEFYMTDARGHESTCRSQLLLSPMHHQNPWSKDLLLHQETEFWKTKLSNFLEDSSLSQQYEFLTLIQPSLRVNFLAADFLHHFSTFLQSNLLVHYIWHLKLLKSEKFDYHHQLDSYHYTKWKILDWYVQRG